jgi:hypothetical protein
MTLKGLTYLLIGRFPILRVKKGDTMNYDETTEVFLTVSGIERSLKDAIQEQLDELQSKYPEMKVLGLKAIFGKEKLEEIKIKYIFADDK